ncbi:MAG: imidazole glycerol phosphate synthase glutamine amidotransferase subunit [Planctomycetota bacterium]|jgi:imidazole glycerol phosphate synthase glutamine amidotransferase subunit
MKNVKNEKNAMNATAEVLVVSTGTANTASVLSAFRRLGATARLSDEPSAIRDADYVVLPGVGDFGAASMRLEQSQLSAPLVERIAEGRPTLAICLGMQLLCDASAESPGVKGLGIIPAAIGSFPEQQRVPHMGWNRVEVENPGVLESGFAYFANGYRLDSRPASWSTATTSYGGTFVSAIERGAVLACQFHPELSGVWGERLLSRWLDRGRGQV